jgi:hypothetical protein
MAAVLATLLPSALRVPLSGPSASAEIAPVPGRGNADDGDLAGLGQSSTGGLGFGGGLGGDDGGLGGGTDGEGGPGGKGGNPTNKRCVGKPARQTEDPLSPPCVAFFSGDNSGATAKGVSGTEIRVVVEECSTGSPETHVDYNDPDDPNRQPWLVAYASHFNERYQFYGRRLHFFGVMWGDCAEGPVRKSQLQDIESRYHPFAMIAPAGLSDDATAETARLHMVTFLRSAARSFMQQWAPYVYSVYPDLDEHMAMTAAFLCARLAGRPARHSGDVADQGRQRVFGISYRNAADPGRAGVQMFTDEVARRCPGTEVTDYSAEYSGNVDDVPLRMAAMREDGVTTVVKLNTVITEAQAASGMGWHPEWFTPGPFLSNAASTSFPADEWRNAFGFLFYRRLGIRAQQVAYQAAADGCDGCGQYARSSEYELLLLLARGIQAAGPRLTPANFDKGLHAIRPERSLDPFLPAAYLSPGNYSFIKDAMAVWWDVTGRPPGSSRVGCYRLIEQGLRYRTDDWASGPGDEGIKQDDGSQPCQGD